MANPTTNFGWVMPTSASLVTNLPADFNTFGQAVDTSMAQLKGGTTGQVLSKTSATDMAFTWVTTDDANAIQNSIVDAKGDIVAASANDTPARLAVGANGTLLTADSSAATGLSYQNNFAAGKNKIINGDFSIFQRSTSATMSADATYYAPDRWKSYFTSGGTTVTWSRQTFTPGAAPVAGYEGQYFSRISAASSFSASGEIGMYQPIENVQTFAGQQITVSFWAKADSARTSTIFISQNFGSGGSSPVSTLTSQALTTSWVRYSLTVTIASISGKTIGTGSALNVGLLYTAGNATGAPVMDVWGFQVEAGSVATAFQTATGTVQGEIAACQRYFIRIDSAANADLDFSSGAFLNTSLFRTVIPLQVTMRSAPTAVYSAVGTWQITSSTNMTPTGFTLNSAGNKSFCIGISVASLGTAGYAGLLRAAGTTSAYFELSAEL